MRLLRLAAARWVVLAVLDRDDACPLLDLLQEGHKEGAKEARDKMLSLLTKSVPFDGPQIDNPTVCKPLRPVADGLYEFRKQPKRGSKPRVIWFFDGDAVIVCTVAFFKRDQTPQSKIDEALAMKEEYFRAKQQRRLEIVDLPEKRGKGKR